MQIVIPMSGTGERFKAAGYKEPKPLIVVDGRPMIEHVVNLFPGENDFLFICNREHLENTNLREVLKRIKPTGKIVAIDPHKLGPIGAVLAAQEHIDDADEVVVNYCDFSMLWDYKKFLELVRSGDWAGALPYYTGFHPHLLAGNFYAGIHLDDKGRVLKIREKHRFTEDPMDGAHSPGTHYFKTGLLLKSYSQKAVDGGAHINGEYYMPMAYEAMLDEGLPVRGFAIEQFCQWGTPEDLRDYNNWMHIVERHKGKIPDHTNVSPDARRIFEYWNSYRKHSAISKI